MKKSFPFSSWAYYPVVVFLVSASVCASIPQPTELETPPSPFGSPRQIRHIRHIAFDLFGVLLRVDKNQADNEIETSPPSPRFNSETVMSSPRWSKLDEGSATAEDVADDEALKQKQNQAAVIQYITNIGRYVKPIRAGMAIFNSIKQQKRHDLYILSNISQYCLEGIRNAEFFDRVSAEDGTDYPSIFEDIAGEFYSYFVQKLKPDIGIYQLFLETFQPIGLSLNDFASRTLFIDDSPCNLIGAQKAGIVTVSCQCHAVLYHSLVRLRIIKPDKNIESLIDPIDLAHFKQFTLSELHDYERIAHDLRELHPERYH